MSVADELLKANQEFARNFKLGELSVRPKRHVAVLACMDSRILFEHCLGLRPGDAHMIRNAGGIATDDALRSLIVSHHLLDTQEFIIINHTDCGLLKVREDELKARLTEKMGTAADEPAHFHADASGSGEECRHLSLDARRPATLRFHLRCPRGEPRA